MTRAYKTTYEDVYKFHAKYGRVPPQDRGDDYWKRLADEMSEYIKARNDSFTVDLFVAATNELERECKEGKL